MVVGQRLDRTRGRELMAQLIESVSVDVPSALTELITLRRILKKRAADVLAYFDRPGTSNGLTEAINERLKQLRGSALGFRNLTNYVARSGPGKLTGESNNSVVSTSARSAHTSGIESPRAG